MKLYTFKPKKNAAQAMVEFAIVLPLLLLLLYGLLEAGRLLFIYSTIVTASRQAARYGSATGEGINPGIPRYQDCAGIRVAANRVDFLNAFNEYDVIIQHDHGPGGSAPEYYCTNKPGSPPDPSLPLDATDPNFKPANNDERLIVTIVGDYNPIVPRIVPFLTRTVAGGNPIRAISARTILTGVPIEVTPPPGSGPGPSPTGLTLSVTTNISTYTSTADQIIFSFVLKNDSNPPVDITGPFTITFDINGVSGSVTCADSPLAPGATAANCQQFTYVPTATDVSLGADIVLSNAIANNGAGTVSNSAGATVKFAPQPAITLAKSASPTESSVVGQVITYTFTVTNTGNVAVTGVAVSDPLVGGAVAGCTGDLAVGATVTCTATYSLKNNDVNENGPKTLDNNASASATFNTQTATANASATVYTGGLSLSASATPTSVNQVGQVITYTYILRNNTNHDLSAPFAVNDSRLGSVACPQAPNPLPAGQTIICTGSESVTQATLDAGNSLTSSATASAANGNKTSTSNSVSLKVDVVTSPALTMQLTAAPNPATTLGTIITYTYTVTNTGNVTLSAPAITDSRITGITCPASLAPGAVQNCTASYTVTQADLDAGSITNQASGMATFKSQPVSSAPQSLTVLTFVGSRVRVQITPNPTTFNGVGQFIVYTYTITNTGSNILYGPYSVVDSKVSFVDCSTAAPSLGIGASTMCVGTYATTQADLDSNYINTSATVGASDGTQAVPSVAATATVQTPWAPTPPPTCTAAPVTLTASADSWVDQFSPTATTGGTATTLSIQSRNSRNNRALVQFTLPSMPAGCKIQSATLRLFASSSTSGRTLQALQVSGTWAEGGVNWNNQPSTTGTAATATSGAANQYLEWTVTNILQAIYSGTNNGFLIRDASEGASGNGVQQIFVSRESATNQPQLVITYTQAP